MADEVRRSGRANKGHHTKNADALDEPVAKPKAKPKTEKKDKAADKAQAARSQSAQTAENEEEEDALIRCVCGDQRDIRGRQMICCDSCEAWQHNRCLNLPEGDYWDNKQYYCEQCKPEDHKDLLAAMARGEKPWNKKKGQKPPKSRPSDVKPEGKPPKSKGATPQPSQPATPSTAAAQPSPQPSAPVPAPPAPMVAAPEASQDTPSVQVEVKPEQKEAVKNQPQSPVGEKRRLDSSADKDSSNKKRRKSSSANTLTTTAPQTGVATEIDALPPKQKSMAEKLRDTLIPLINDAADSRSYRIPDGQTARSLATQFALDIDHAMLERHGEPESANSPFSSQVRSVMFNIKKNTNLVDQLLSKSLKAEDFASMTSEEMASEEKQREYAAIREANVKQVLLKEDTGPHYRKTHKGEELVDNDNEHQHDDFKAPAPPRDRDNEDSVQAPSSPVQEQQMTVELPEDIEKRAPIAVDTTSGADSTRRPSSNFDINSVFAQVRSPQTDQQAFSHRRQSSVRAPEKASGPGVDADVDRLLKDEDGDVEMTGFGDDTIVWQGSIHMQQMEPFAVVARFIAGGDFGKAVPWEKLLSSSLPIQGRIEEGKGDEYIRGLAMTGSHDVAVLALSPVTAEGRDSMDHLYRYFQPRNRWGVVPVDKLESEAMRDLYVVPIPPGGSNLPGFIDMLEYCTIESPRKEHMLLLALVAKLPDVQPAPPQFEHQALEATPVQPAPMVHPPNGTSGPSPSPLTNPHAPSYSPVAPSFPPGHHFANNFPALPIGNGVPHGLPHQAPSPPVNPLVAEILGPYMHTATAKTIVGAQPGISREQLESLRAALDKVPAAREDIGELSKHLAQSNGALANGQA